MSLVGLRGRLIGRYGRPVTLARLSPAATVTVTGKLHAYSPEELVGGVQQGDQRIELAAVPSSLGAPVRGDRVTVDGRTWQVMGATPRHVGASLVGYTLWLRGG